MTRQRILIGLVVAGAVAGSAAPALASGTGSRGTSVCLVATHDRNNPGPAPLCVVVPVDSAP